MILNAQKILHLYILGFAPFSKHNFHPKPLMLNLDLARARSPQAIQSSKSSRQTRPARLTEPAPLI